MLSASAAARASAMQQELVGQLEAAREKVAELIRVGEGGRSYEVAFLPPYPCTTVMYRIPCAQYESSCRELRMQSEQATSEASQMRRMLAAKDEELATACGCGGGGMWIYVWGACGCGGTQM